LFERIVFTRFLPMSCTSPNTVASTTRPLETSADFSRYRSSWATAFFITSRALEHERQDQLAGAELVPDLFHGREQHRVQDNHRVLALDRLVDERLDARGPAGGGSGWWMRSSTLIAASAAIVLACARVRRAALESG
jgi:hypothetical protein